MSLYRKLSRKPKLFLCVTGMNLHQFQALLPQFEHADDKFEQRRKRKVVRTGKKRLRQIGGGAPFANSLPDRLLMLLFYYRLYLTQEFMTLLFKAEHKASSVVASFRCVPSLNQSCPYRSGRASGFCH
jgi:hypothetical protein